MKHRSLLLFVSVLLGASLACNAFLGNGESDATAPDPSELVDLAVATLQAEAGAGQPATVNPATNVTVSSDLEAALINVYERVNPAVVFIVAEHATLDLNSGSGFVYDDEGHIVTNNHVVAQGDDFEVVFSDGSRRAAEVTGTDVHSDLAVIKVDSLPVGVQAVALGDFDEVRVGQFVAAIGNPFGEQGSISFGIVSGLGRTITSREFAEDGGTYSLPEVIQTDTPINPGNSGGPLLNLKGEVIGVNSAIRSDTGFNSGVGFAIPVVAVRRVVPSLIAEGTYVYPYIGIGTSGFPIDLDRQEALDLPQASGVYVTRVTPGSPAEEAGIVAAPSAQTPGGDLIVAIDGQDVKEFADLISYLVFEAEVGQTIELTVIRDGEEMTIPLTLAERP